MLSARRFTLLTQLVLLLTGFACSSVPKETPKGKAVQVIKSPFAETCIQVGKIKYEGTPFIHDKELLIIMKENAAKLGGNALRLDTFTPGVTGVSNAKGLGTSFKCKPSQLRAYLLNPNKFKAKDAAEGEGEEGEGTNEEAETQSAKQAKPASSKKSSK